MAEQDLQDGMQPDGTLRVTIHPKQEAPSIDPIAEDNFGKIQQALSMGLSRDDISSYLQEQNKLDKDTADKQVIDSVSQKVKMAKEKGLNDQEIKDYLVQNKYDMSVVDSAMQSSTVTKKWKKYEWDPNTKVEEAKDIADLYSEIHGKYSTLGKQLVGFVDEQKGIEARQEINQLNLGIVNQLKKKGIDAFIHPQTGEAMMRDEQGREQEVDSSLLNSIYNAKGEIAGAIAGGKAGAKAGAKMPGRAKLFAVPGGALAGSAIGASIGKAADMTINAAILKEDIEGKLYVQQMKEAGIFDITAGVVGAVIFKSGKAGYKQIMKAYDFVTAGNTNGAYRALTEDMLISDDQAKDLVKQWEDFNGKAAPGKNYKEKAISVLTTTQQGGESFVKFAAAKDPRLSTVIISDIDKRAKGLFNAIDTVPNDNIGKFIRDDLGAYQKDVKTYYGNVKQVGIDAIQGTDFRFDLDRLAIQPVMDNIQKQISNPIKREQFLSYASRIESASQDRTFGGLLELRQAVNDFKYSKTGLSTPDLEALNTVLNKIDGQVGKAVKEYMPENGKDWIQHFQHAKTEYAKMKQFEDNTLFKLVNRKGITEDGIQKVLSKYGNTKDVDQEVFNKLVERLTPATRVKVEGAAIRNLTNKYTLGESVDKQAIHFPALANHLKSLNINTPEGKNIVRAVDEIAKIYKNDVELSRLSGNLALPKSQTFLSTSPVGRAQMQIMTNVFTVVTRYLPTRESRNLALVHKVDKLLQNPLHAKTAEDLVKSYPVAQQAELRSLVKELQIETAKAPKVQQDFVKMYKQTKSGKLTATDGALGKGVYLVDKVKNPSPESKVVKHEVNMSRMAGIKDISSLYGREVSEKELRNIPDLQAKLVEKGYLGIKLEGKAMLFPETTKGVKTAAPKAEKSVSSSMTETEQEALLAYRSRDGFYIQKHVSTISDADYVKAIKDLHTAYKEGDIDTLEELSYSVKIPQAKVNQALQSMEKATTEDYYIARGGPIKHKYNSFQKLTQEEFDNFDAHKFYYNRGTGVTVYKIPKGTKLIEPNGKGFADIEEIIIDKKYLGKPIKTYE